jgi:hypothetical protein
MNNCRTGSTGKRAQRAQPTWLTFFAMSVNGQLLRFLKPALHFAMINPNFSLIFMQDRPLPETYYHQDLFHGAVCCF